LSKTILNNNPKDRDGKPQNSRRNFLKTAGVATAGLAISDLEILADNRYEKRVLNLHNIHFNKTYHANFANGNRYDISGLFAIDQALMDHRAWQIARIDLKLVNLLYQINRYVGLDHKINIISGYRSPKTNHNLRRYNKGVAKKSHHMKAEAADIQISGVRLSRLRGIAKGLAQGGVGYYPRSNFLHIDVGPVRNWRGA
jgi:uncharacterized protein YcbK (DUF882 family)